jgi:hypothetical protein
MTKQDVETIADVLRPRPVSAQENRDIERLAEYLAALDADHAYGVAKFLHSTLGVYPFSELLEVAKNWSQSARLKGRHGP